MEDFAPVIWILVIIGASIYGTVSQARKKALGGSEKHAHGEAWPSWDKTSAPEQEYNDQQAAFEEQAELQEPRPHTREIHQEDRQPHSRLNKSSEISPKTSEYEHETDPMEAHTTYEHPAEIDAHALQNALWAKTGTQTSAEQIPNAFTESTDETSLTQTDEAFDLRRAVIYAEILKPKFDE